MAYAHVAAINALPLSEPFLVGGWKTQFKRLVVGALRREWCKKPMPAPTAAPTEDPWNGATLVMLILLHDTQTTNSV